MKVAITSTGKTLDDPVDLRFGRCSYFLIVDLDTLEVECLENAGQSVGGGAGIQSAQKMADKDVKTVLTGNCGPNAYRTLDAAGIEVVVGVSGIIREAIERYRKGDASPIQAPSVGSHHGMTNAQS